MFGKVAIGAGTLALALALSACSSPSGSTSAAVDAQAAAPPTTPAAASAGQAANQGNRPNRGPNVAGTVQSVNGSSMTIQTQQNNQTVTVQIASDATIRKQVNQTIADLKPGATIFATGQQSGNIVQARQIRVGGPQGTGRPNGGGPGGNGTPGPGAAFAGLTIVAGTVDSVSGDTLSVKSANGSTVQVQLTANGRITAQESGTLADITAGKYVVVGGQQQGTTVTASSVTLSDAPPVGGNAGNAPAAS